MLESHTETESKLRLPIIDPLGIFEELSKEADANIYFYDPIFSRKESKSESKGDVNQYVYYLEKALYYAPCPSCRDIAISALTAAEIYKVMTVKGGELSKEEIEDIKKKVREKYGKE